ncbi:MAG: FHA domain-containing protein [Myxococcota bacterium]
MDRVPLLVAIKGPLKGQRYTVTRDGLMVGRDDDCDVVIPDAGVSRQHARVLLHNAAVWVQDEGSRNGVFVNGKRVVRHRQLSPGAELLIGEHAFTLEMTIPTGTKEPASHTVPPVDEETPNTAPRRWGVLFGAAILTLALAAGLLYTLT